MEYADCVIPAAGPSTRMGEWKALLPFRDKTIIETVVETALVACPRVVLVVGYRGSELAALFRQSRVTVVENPHWESGMFGSLQRGIQVVKTKRFFITLSDMPLLEPEVYGALLGHSSRLIVPVFQGEWGHPVLLDRGLGDEALSNPPVTRRMKDLLKRHDVTEMPWNSDSVLYDVDTPEDYRCLLTR